MPSLNEIKIRKNSVDSTKKITSAMMMIASAKLSRAQNAIYKFLPYQKKLDHILMDILAADPLFESVYSPKKEVKRCAIIMCASNSSLCGAYNSNIYKEFLQLYHEKAKLLGETNIDVYTVGKKLYDLAEKSNIKPIESFDAISDHPTYEDSEMFARKLSSKFINHEVDEIFIIYSHLVNTARQDVTKSKFLPFELNFENPEESVTDLEIDYIFEPAKKDILNSLIPQVLYSRLYASFMDSNASEHASRMVAMQTATDNAKKLNDELTLQYNKQRQQAITNQLLDIISGANAIKGK